MSCSIRLHASPKKARPAPSLFALALTPPPPSPALHRIHCSAASTTAASFLPLTRCKALRSTPGTINRLGLVQRHLRHNTAVAKDAKRWPRDLTDSLSVCSMMSRSQAPEVSASSCRARSMRLSSIDSMLTSLRSWYQRARRCRSRVLRESKGRQKLAENRGR